MNFVSVSRQTPSSLWEGAFVGAIVGTFVGLEVIPTVGLDVGDFVGLEVIPTVGLDVGDFVGLAVGCDVTGAVKGASQTPYGEIKVPVQPILGKS